MPCSRRQFIALTAVLASTSALVKEAAAAEAVAPTDPTAVALGYKPDAAQVDKAKYPKYQTGQMCGKCQFFQGKAGAPTGPCQMFGGKLVNAGGWCSAYVKKA